MRTLETERLVIRPFVAGDAALFKRLLDEAFGSDGYGSEDATRLLLDYNVIADSKGGDPNSVLVVDAQLDAIFGAGMLDNASGSTTMLDIAQMMRKVRP